MGRYNQSSSEKACVDRIVMQTRPRGTDAGTKSLKKKRKLSMVKKSQQLNKLTVALLIAFKVKLISIVKVNSKIPNYCTVQVTPSGSKGGFGSIFIHLIKKFLSKNQMFSTKKIPKFIFKPPLNDLIKYMFDLKKISRKKSAIWALPGRRRLNLRSVVATRQ